MKNHKATTYVLGMTCNGLSVVRSLGRRGIRVVAVDPAPQKPSLKSRYCHVVIAPTNIIDDETPWLDFLISLARKESIKPVLFPTEDAYVLFIAKHRKELSEYYEFNIPPDSIVDASVSKLGTYNLAKKHNIPTPWTYVIKNMADYQQIADKITFPCALKPSYAHIWLKKYTYEKLLVIEHTSELETRLQDLDRLGIEVVLQEIIPGGDNQVYVFAVYVNRQGQVLGYANLHKLRQQPVDFGVGAFDISVDEPRLTETALQLIERAGYTGMASTEYKLDPRDGKFKLIDINPRTCMIGELAIASGVDLPYLYYCDMTGQQVAPQRATKLGVKWQCFEWDFLSFLEYRRRGQLTFPQWISSLRGEKVYAYYAKDDPKPFVAATFLFCKRIISYFGKKAGIISPEKRKI